jgi:hypothetical protein
VVVAQASPMLALEALPIAVAHPWQDTFPGGHTCAAVDVAPILAASNTRRLRSLLTSHSTFYSSPSFLLSAKHQNPSAHNHLPFPPSATIAHPQLILSLSFSLSLSLSLSAKLRSYGRSSVLLLQGRFREQSLCWCRHSRGDLLRQWSYINTFRERNRPAPTRRRREKKKGSTTRRRRGGFRSDE